jgi:predicted outer membrane repeat protein
MKKLALILFTVHCSLSTVHPGRAQIIHVPADQPTIQAGIGAADEGDTVLVDPGTYVENINFNGKCITVASHYLTTQDGDYISQTIIDGNEAGSVVVFENGEDTTTLLCGFMLTNGYALAGGGIFCNQSSPKIENAIICDNSSTGSYSWMFGGGGICCASCPIVSLKNLKITRNYAKLKGGGIFCYNYTFLILENVTVSYNVAGDRGGGICSYASCLNFDEANRCNIFMNDADYATDIYYQGNEKNEMDALFSHEQPGDDIEPISPFINPLTYSIILDTFTVSYPTDFHAVGNYLDAFDILNGKVNQADNDLYVSPSGSDENNGLTPESPLQTVHQAFRIIRADSSHWHSIHLMDGNYSNSSNNETFPVYLPDYVNLAGTGADKVVLDAEQAGFVMRMGANIVSYMTITNGAEGGVICGGGSFLDHLRITNNIAFMGGGVFSHCDAEITNSEISNNMAQFYGGGIYCYYNIHLNLENVRIVNNGINGEGNLTTAGGGIYGNENSNISVNNSVIDRNTAMQGGGIFFKGDNLEMTDVIIQENSATGDTIEPGCGGGIYTTNSNVYMENVIFRNNTSGGQEMCGGIGGGLYCSNSTLEMLNSTFCYNSAETYGGGIYAQNSSHLIFNDSIRCNIFLNTAKSGSDLCSGDDQQIVVVDTFTVLHPVEYFASPFQNFSFDILNGKLPQYNADVYVSPDGDDSNSGLTQDEPLKTIRYAFTKILKDTLHPNTIHLSEGTYAASATGESFPIKIPPYINISGISKQDVILDAEGQNHVIEIFNNDHSIISGMTVTGSNFSAINLDYTDLFIHDLIVKGNEGDGIHCDHSSPSIFNTLITLNKGYGLHCDQSSPELDGIIISGNNRGGILCESGSNPYLGNTLIEANTAEYGGGIYCRGSSNPYIVNSVIKGNTATVWGGGICNLFSGPVLENVLISDNSAEDGGGIFSMTYDTEPVFDWVSIIGNSAYNQGGGIFFSNINSALSNMLIEGNTANEGGAIYCDENSVPMLLNLTITGNEAEVGGGIFCSRRASPVLINTVLWQNSPSEVYFDPEGEPVGFTASWSNIQGGEGGIITNDNGVVNWLEGNIDADPLFVNSGDFPYAVSASSPCINTGSVDTTGLFLPLSDLAGNPRIWDERIDMGAFEWNNTGFEETLVVSRQSSVNVCPNPTSGIVDFRFSILDSRWVTLKIYDLQGREVAVALDGRRSGDQVVRWDASSLPAGVYSYQLRAEGEGQRAVGKVIKIH